MTPEIINGLFSLAGAAIGGIIGYLAARSMFFKTSKAEAGAKLRAAFAPEIAEMRLFARGQKIDVEQLLNSAFPRHATAIEEFSAHLSEEKKQKYYQAWRNYYEVAGSIRFFDYYIGDEPYKLFFERIDVILQFTK